ncbi:MAG: cysteine desulfurase-like protein [Candidatus Dormibacteraeota bacterium]|jgi:cysteine desulfurase family protein (TIGR01976 family)|nr:cysteine desulfurase-like protein [Candidatus Dormibacteraeota bacterium]
MSSEIADLDTRAIRAHFPALADGRAYLDAAAGTQTPESVISAIAGAYRQGLSNTDGFFPASQHSNRLISECRQAVADLVGGDPQGVVMGPSMTSLTYKFSQLLASEWSPGDEIVISRLEHDGNFRPWVQAAARAGATVRVAEVDLATGELPVDQYEHLVGPRTRLVAVTAASNVLGTRPDVSRITAIAHAEGALTYVDGVHATPHMPVDVKDLGADFYVTSAYKWCGPHVAALVASPSLLDRYRPDKLLPASNEVPDRFQLGTPPLADYAGVAAAVDHLAGLVGPSSGSRRQRIIRAMAALEASEERLFKVLLDALLEIPGITVFGRAVRRAPTAYFTVAGHSPDEVASRLAAQGVNVWSGDNYAYEITKALGLEPQGAVRAGLAHYNDHSDVDRLISGLQGI